MQTPELTHLQIALAPQSVASVRTWTAGQILQATVVRQTQDGTVTLRVGQQEIQARTGLALANEQPLTLQVAQAGQKVVLRILNTNSADATSPQQTQSPHAEKAQTEQATLSQAWRQTLPRAGDLHPLLQQLSQHIQPQTNTNASTVVVTSNTTPAPASNPPLPPQVMQSLRELLLQFPTPAALATPAGLRQAINDSGLFLEHHLAQASQQGTPPQVQHDLKAALTQLVATLRAQLPPASANEPASLPAPLNTLLQQADAALARIEQHQLTALSQTATGQPAPLIVEVPVRSEPHPEVMKLVIEEDQHATAEGTAKNWNVWLHFDFESLGHVEARVSLTGNTVSIGWWAEQPTTTTLFNAHLTELVQILQKVGLAPSLMPCQQGRPRKSGGAETAPQRLLDERA